MFAILGPVRESFNPNFFALFWGCQVSGKWALFFWLLPADWDEEKYKRSYESKGIEGRASEGGSRKSKKLNRKVQNSISFRLRCCAVGHWFTQYRFVSLLV